MTQGQPAAVSATGETPAAAQQAGAVRSRWSWIKGLAWTDRMLTALENGVKGGKWFRLFDKVFSERNLFCGFQQVARNNGASGVDHVSVEAYEEKLMPNLRELSRELREGTYTPQAIRRVWIDKPGSTEKRPLGIPTVRDRVVQATIVQVMEPIFEHGFAEHSYGFRPRRGCKDALRQVDRLIKAGYCYVVDADLKSYFDSIPHERLMTRLKEKIADGRVLSLIASFLKTGIMDGLSQWTPEAGAPQGAVLSPLLSNVYLNPLDHQMAAQGFAMIRYADDFVVLCRTREEAERALEVIRQWVDANGLTLHPTKTRIADVRTEGFDFLGYHFRKLRHWPREKSMVKFQGTIRAKTRRSSGASLAFIIANVNRTLRGWFEYYKHSPYWTFREVDGYVRGRLRSILRRRSGRRGRGRGRDHHRWPKAFFVRHGLFTLETAHRLICQPSRR
jgi:RNA-directed DNA polymerase